MLSRALKSALLFGGKSPFSITNLSGNSDSADLTTYTHSLTNVPEPRGRDTRHLIIGAGGTRGSNFVTSLCSIFGLSASLVVRTTTNPAAAGMYIAEVPQGKVGDVLVTMSNGSLGNGYYAWLMTNGNPLPVATTQSITVAAGAITLDTTIRRGEIALGFGTMRDDATETTTWSGLTGISTKISMGSNNFTWAARGETLGAPLAISLHQTGTPLHLAGVVATFKAAG